VADHQGVRDQGRVSLGGDFRSSIAANFFNRFAEARSDSAHTGGQPERIDENSAATISESRVLRCRPSGGVEVDTQLRRGDPEVVDADLADYYIPRVPSLSVRPKSY
jgi:hypothetical protein